MSRSWKHLPLLHQQKNRERDYLYITNHSIVTRRKIRKLRTLSPRSQSKQSQQGSSISVNMMLWPLVWPSHSQCSALFQCSSNHPWEWLAGYIGAFPSSWARRSWNNGRLLSVLEHHEVGAICARTVSIVPAEQWWIMGVCCIFHIAHHFWFFEARWLLWFFKAAYDENCLASGWQWMMLPMCQRCKIGCVVWKHCMIADAELHELSPFSSTKATLNWTPQRPAAYFLQYSHPHPVMSRVSWLSSILPEFCLSL